ncbi:MFS transporter [Microbacterium mitrae]|uniref:MFS transporter n=2 Tax=Microbacterium mitrae TaxID=664640 RepID=A0A5C8HLB5_9MICO|nr:MFS transporter [Microbacterium mitrae]
MPIMGESLAHEDGRAPERSGGSLWRDRNFLTMWSGQALAQLGSQVAELAIPTLAVLLLSATELEVGYLNAAAVAAFLLVGLPAGAWVDRMRKRHVMIVADAVRTLALSALPLLWFFGDLQMWHMFVVAAVVGIANVFFDVSYQSLVPSLVPAKQIAEANGKLESTAQVAGIAGPAVGGWLVGVLTAPFAILATVGTYVVSLIALIFTKDTERIEPRTEMSSLISDIGEGLRWVFGNRYLKRIVATTAVSNFFSTLSFTLLPIFILRELGLSVANMGLIFSLAAVGGLLGAMSVRFVVARLGEAPAIPISAIGFSLTAILLPVAAMVPSIAFALLIVQGFIASFTVLVYNITQVTFRQRITPRRLLGRMNASIRFVVWGVMPLSALLAGFLGDQYGVVTTMWVGAIGQVVSALFVIFGPFWSTRELPPAIDA